MRSYPLQAVQSAPQIAAADAAALIDHLGEARFAHTVLGIIGAHLAASHCSILLRSPAGDTCALEAASLEGDGARLAGDAYVSAGFYAHDRTFADPSLSVSGGVLTLQTRDEVSSSDHRKLCYDRLGIAQRVSFAARLDDGAIVATNFYRCATSGALDERALEAAQALAQPLLAAVRKHSRLRAPRAEARGAVCTTAPTDWARLSERERDVAQLCVRGFSAKEIARALDIAVTTVNTLKQRAYQKLGIRRQSELVALLSGTRVAPLDA
ncbi:DNA-binding CsgD family transcriptional regulator [Paraburkholderia unamae]|uniref:helix-turn-helix transcriptional regulator n=1 Tax=Paraburkholderia unamae TaxID=219649 RepID=UPI000DC5BE47|nr:helix-turn-helix transcriptional regulator [Paraburkholderia unamae]RAR65981.1 DNA-binding CsgD family transcriptional regulator [Paraburkholderia unamae]